MRDAPSDPGMAARVGMVAGAEAEMHACSRAAEEIRKRRAGIRDEESRELSRRIGELFYRQAGIYHLLSVVLLSPPKKKAPIGLWGHLCAWWRERRG